MRGKSSVTKVIPTKRIIYVDEHWDTNLGDNFSPTSVIVPGLEVVWYEVPTKGNKYCSINHTTSTSLPVSLPVILSTLPCDILNISPYKVTGSMPTWLKTNGRGLSVVSFPDLPTTRRWEGSLTKRNKARLSYYDDLR